MKSTIPIVILALFAAVELSGQASDNSVTSLILSGYSERAYTTEPVTDQQLELILKCGIKAPSGMNRQPWKFTVIRDEPTMKDAINDVVAGNVLIIISGVDAQDGSGPDLFGCGLATESMFIAAHGLGLGARIYGSPVANVNSRREVYQIPTGYKAVMILRIGNPDKNVDAVSAASPRKGFEEVVNFRVPLP
jgi:nitroreductase